MNPSSEATLVPDQGFNPGSLAGVTVLDLTRVLAGPYCTMVLADLGARVIKVEMPQLGDDARHIGPFVQSVDGQRHSAYFFSVNRNKESITLDLKDTADRVVFDRMLENADVLVENFTPGVIDRLGYGWDHLHQKYPRLVLASISGFGQTGPYAGLPAYDMVVQAMGGVLSLTGEEGGPPTRVGVSIGDLAAGLFGVIGVQAALLERMRSGRGRHVDVAMLDCQVALLESALARLQVEQRTPGPIGSRHPSITPFGLFRAADGHVVIAAGNDALFARLCSALGLAGLELDIRFASNSARCQHHAELKQEIEAALSAHPCGHWLLHLMRQGLPCGPMNDVHAVMNDAQVAARGMLVPMTLPDGRSIRVAGNPVRFADEKVTAFRPAPHLDQHRATLLAEFGLLPTEQDSAP